MHRVTHFGQISCNAFTCSEFSLRIVIVLRNYPNELRHILFVSSDAKMSGAMRDQK